MKKSRIEASAQALSHLNPAAVLARGYALVQDERGAILRDARALTHGDGIRVRLARGRVVAVVSAVDIEAP